jgi:hypothetical protein
MAQRSSLPHLPGLQISLISLQISQQISLQLLQHPQLLTSRQTGLQRILHVRLLTEKNRNPDLIFRLP